MTEPTEVSYARWYVGACALLVLVLGLFNWAVDPLQFYRRATLYPPVFSENQRYQKPGLAKHYDYEIVVLGDSHAENFSARTLESRLGAPALNLAISGSTAHEQRLILEKAIETGRVRRVIWILGRIPFRKAYDAVTDSGGEFPFHFYQEGPSTYSSYLLSLDTVGLSFDALRGDGPRELDSLNMWHEDHEFSQARMLMDWRRRSQLFASFEERGAGYRPQIEGIRRNIHENVQPIVRDHPEIRFDLVFPPYSILSYVIDDRMEPWMFEERLQYKRALVEAVVDLPNAHVHDFQVVRAITHDLDNYKDLEHYRVEINERIVDALASGAQQVDKRRYEAVLKAFEAQVVRFKRQACAAEGPMRALCPDRALPRSSGGAEPRT